MVRIRPGEPLLHDRCRQRPAAYISREHWTGEVIPAGYLLKRVVPPPGWLVTAPAHIKEVCSVAGCVNEDVVDVQRAWRSNGFGLANSPSLLWELAEANGTDAAGAALFFYEAYERELDSDGWEFDPVEWRERARLQPAEDDRVELPKQDVRCLGFDVVVSGRDFLEHSPLSCNAIARDVAVNEHCLFESFAAAKHAIDSGSFGGGCEEGAYSIFSVSLIPT